MKERRHIPDKREGKQEVSLGGADPYPLKLVRLAMISSGIVGTFGNLAS